MRWPESASTTSQRSVVFTSSAAGIAAQLRTMMHNAVIDWVFMLLLDGLLHDDQIIRRPALLVGDRLPEAAMDQFDAQPIRFGWKDEAHRLGDARSQARIDQRRRIGPPEGRGPHALAVRKRFSE